MGWNGWRVGNKVERRCTTTETHPVGSVCRLRPSAQKLLPFVIISFFIHYFFIVFPLLILVSRWNQEVVILRNLVFLNLNSTARNSSARSFPPTKSHSHSNWVSQSKEDVRQKNLTKGQLNTSRIIIKIIIHIVRIMYNFM